MKIRMMLLLVLFVSTFNCFGEDGLITKSDYSLVREHAGKLECNDKLSLKPDEEILCLFLNYYKNKNAKIFLKESRKVINRIRILDDVVGANFMFSALYYKAMAEASTREEKEGISLLLDLIEMTDGYYSTNAQGAFALLFKQYPQLIVRNVDLIHGRVISSKKISYFDSDLCVDKKSFDYYMGLENTDKSIVRKIRETFEKICPGLPSLKPPSPPAKP